MMILSHSRNHQRNTAMKREGEREELQHVQREVIIIIILLSFNHLITQYLPIDNQRVSSGWWMIW